MYVLYDYETDDPIREATAGELAASQADEDAGGDGMIVVDWRPFGGWNGEDVRRCYVYDHGSDLGSVDFDAQGNQL